MPSQHGRKGVQHPRARRLKPSEYVPYTKKYLANCGKDATVGDVWKAMRADDVQVGYWLNPILIHIDRKRFGHLKVSNKVPEGTPVRIVDVNGELRVVSED